VEKVSAGQLLQTRSLLVVMFADTYSPAVQLLAGMQLLLLLPGWYEFMPHVLQPYELGAGELVPAGQLLQTRSLLPVRLALTYWPAVEMVAARQPSWFVPAENVPSLQLLHTRSLLAVRLTETYCPAVQLVPPTQLLWLALAWYESALQALHL